MPRPRTVNKKIPDLSRGMRKVGQVWWRGTDGLTKEIEPRLKAAGLAMRCGTTPIQPALVGEAHLAGAGVGDAGRRRGGHRRGADPEVPRR